MISLRKLSTATKFLLFLAPILAASGCTTVEYPTATSKAAALLQAEPGSERLLRYCRRMAETNNLRIAVGVCQRALEAAPDNPAPVLALADAYNSAQKEKEAAEAYRFALMIDASNPEAHYGLGKLYLKRSELEMAARHLEAALSSRSEDPAIYNALGILNDQRGDHATAQAHYHAGLTLDPDNSALANNLGVSLLLSERLNEGAALLGSVDIRERLNMTRRQNLAAAQAAIAAASAPKRQEMLGSKLPVVRSLDQVQTVSSSNNDRTPIVADAHPAKAQWPLPQPTAVKARPAPAPKLAIAAPVVTLAPTSRATGHSVGPITHDPLEASRNLELHPSITPAPVTVVDFQELPPLPKATRQIADTRPVVARELEIVAEALPDLPNTTKSSTTDTGAAKTVTIAAARDLSGILPRRKPLALAAAAPKLAPQVAPETAIPEHAVPENAAPLLVADVPHLPIDEDSDAQDAADESLQAEEGDQRAETDGGSTQVATQLQAQTTAWGPEAALGDELLTRLTASPWPVRFAGTIAAAPSPTPTARHGTRASPQTPKEAPSAPAPLEETARYHEGSKAGVEEEPTGDSKRGNAPDTTPLRSFDLASLPAHPEHRDRERERGQTPPSPTQPSDQPAVDWSGLAAIRETPPDPEPAPRKEPLLALMMIQRDSFSSA